MSDFNLIPLLPEIFLTITALGLLLVGVMQGNKQTDAITFACVVSVIIAFILLLGLDWSTQTALNSTVVFDQFSGFMKALILTGLILSLGLVWSGLEDFDIKRFEVPLLMTLSGIGMMLMVSSHNFLTLYMALELQSLALYVLAAIRRNSVKSSEAGVKYFILGALSSGMLLFGISLIYGYTGSLDFSAIANTLGAQAAIPVGATLGLVFILAGLAFKISAVPFHMWTPDVYQGAPVIVTAFFAIVPKIAAAALLMRVLSGPFMPLESQWIQIVYFISVGSMLLGAFAALVQDNIKRLLAYSSIGNIGYVLIGVVAGTAGGFGAASLYLLIYMITTAGVFAVVLCMRRNALPTEKITDLAGLSVHHPALAYSMAILMFSLAGIPPLAGFFSKLIIFNAAVQQGYVWLAVIGVLTSVVAAYYYLRVIKIMFFDTAGDPFDNTIPFGRRAVLMIAVLFVTVFALKPSIIIESAISAANSLFQ